MNLSTHCSRLLMAILLFSLCTNFRTYGQLNIYDEVFTVIDSLPQSVGGVTSDALGYIYSADFDEKVYKINPFSKKFELFAEGFYLATGNTFDDQGRMYQANLAGNYISRVSRNGEQDIYADSLLASPVGIAFNSRKELLVCNCARQTITKVKPGGETSIFAESFLLHCPNGIALDDADNAYVVSFNNNNIIKITPEGETSLFAQTPDKIGNGHLVFAGDRFYVTGFHGHRIYEVTLDGEVTVLAGTGQRGSQDGNALEATFTYPNGITYDADSKTLYVNERHKGQDLPSIYPCKTSIRAIKLARISTFIKKEIDQKGTKGALALYESLKRHPKFKSENTMRDINRLGHDYLMAGKHKEAVVVFSMNIASYPNNPMAYAFTARALNNSGDSKAAIKYYKKALKLAPNSKSLQARINLLEKGE